MKAWYIRIYLDMDGKTYNAWAYQEAETVEQAVALFNDMNQGAVFYGHIDEGQDIPPRDEFDPIWKAWTEQPYAYQAEERL